jgi:uracil-DNA glycosylase family 4
MPSYVNSQIVPHAKIFFVGEAPGEQESATGKPFVSQAPAGARLNQMLEQAGIIRAECSVGNVARERPPGNDMKFYYKDNKQLIPKDSLLKFTQDIKKEIELYKPNIVVCLGRHALYALTGEHRLRQYRGYVMESNLVKGQKVIGTWHPQATNYEAKLFWQSVMDLRKAVRNSQSHEMPSDPRTLNQATLHQFNDFLDYLYHEHKGPIALDIEVSIPGSHIDIIGIADSANHAESLRILHGTKSRFTVSEEAEMWHRIALVLKTKESIMHNGLYDYAVLWLHNHILAEKFTFDTMIATHIVWPEVPRSLGFISSICLDVPAWKQTSATDPVIYNAADAANTFGCYDVLRKELTKLNSWDTFEFEMSQVEPATLLQLNGIIVDREKQKELLEGDKSIPYQIDQYKKKINFSLGRNVNVKSPQQLKTVLYEDLGLPLQYKRRKKATDPKTVTTEAKALIRLQRISDNPVLDDILQFKKQAKLLTFIDISVSPEGKIHTSYNITGATMQKRSRQLVVDDEESYKSFGRWSSSESIILPYGPGNLQNIPKKARKIYKAPEGFTIVQGDYVQAEAVVVAFVINDQPLKKLFIDAFGLRRSERQERNLDVHKVTASNMFGIPLESVTDEIRSIGKAIRHATNYSAGPGVLSDKLGIAVSESKKLLSMHHMACPQLRIWHSRIQQDLTRTRILSNLLGRKHRFLERWGDELFRSAYSYIPQSTIGDLLNVSLVEVYKKCGDWITLYLQLHDALYVVVPDMLVPKAVLSMRNLMTMPITSGIDTFFIDVDFAIGKSWGDMQEVEWHDYADQATQEYYRNLYEKGCSGESCLDV